MGPGTDLVHMSTTRALILQEPFLRAWKGLRVVILVKAGLKLGKACWLIESCGSVAAKAWRLKSPKTWSLLNPNFLQESCQAVSKFGNSGTHKFIKGLNWKWEMGNFGIFKELDTFVSWKQLHKSTSCSKWTNRFLLLPTPETVQQMKPECLHLRLLWLYLNFTLNLNDLGPVGGPRAQIVHYHCFCAVSRFEPSQCETW